MNFAYELPVLNLSNLSAPLDPACQASNTVHTLGEIASYSLETCSSKSMSLPFCEPHIKSSICRHA